MAGNTTAATATHPKAYASTRDTAAKSPRTARWLGCRGQARPRHVGRSRCRFQGKQGAEKNRRSQVPGSHKRSNCRGSTVTSGGSRALCERKCADPITAHELGLDGAAVHDQSGLEGHIVRAKAFMVGIAMDRERGSGGQKSQFSSMKKKPRRGWFQ